MDTDKDLTSQKMCREKIAAGLKEAKGNALVDKKLRFKALLAMYCPLALKVITKRNKSNADTAYVRFK